MAAMKETSMEPINKSKHCFMKTFITFVNI